MQSQQSQSSTDIFTQGLKQSLSYFRFDPVDLVCGRVAGFPLIEAGESAYLRQEKISLTRYAEHFEAYHHEENLNYIFSRQGTDYYKLTKIEREGGCHISFDYQGKTLKSITDSAGRNIIIESDKNNRILSATVSVGPLQEKKISYAYDAAGNMTAITDAPPPHESFRVVATKIKNIFVNLILK